MHVQWNLWDVYEGSVLFAPSCESRILATRTYSGLHHRRQLRDIWKAGPWKALSSPYFHAFRALETPDEAFIIERTPCSTYYRWHPYKMILSVAQTLHSSESEDTLGIWCDWSVPSIWKGSRTDRKGFQEGIFRWSPIYRRSRILASENGASKTPCCLTCCRLPSPRDVRRTL